MKKLFIDGSCNPQKKIGIGAYFYLEKNILKTTAFTDTSSTKLELETFLWAVKEINEKDLEVYTDCQNLLSLIDRKEKLQQNDYFTKTGKKVKNYLLYKDFYKVLEEYNCSLIKIKGHKKTSLKDNLDLLFTKVDKASRKALRQLLN